MLSSSILLDKLFSMFIPSLFADITYLDKDGTIWISLFLKICYFRASLNDSYRSGKNIKKRKEKMKRKDE